MENAALLALPLFAGLPPAELPRALAALDARRRTFVKGEVLLEAGQHAVPMGVVLAGRVLVEHLDLWGNRTLLGRAAEGELFAETYAFLPAQPMLVSVVAADSGEVLFLDPAKLTTPGCEPWRWQMLQNLLQILAGSKNST
ncbi:MAG: Crp/Fnr family transcriptional regulator, partial [Subdoligranulum sp.]|nr:Crp/Fnr family transcriptional regulator [Subdoligranulum sp.]